EEKEWQDKLARAMNAMYAKAKEFGGEVSGEHGIGSAKKPYLEVTKGSEYMALLKRLKMAFDPKNILNPGKVC
ncbi:MAG: 2-hydroxy-acid oxidase, partial [Firmicutes bacterium]|nr:2-hydroxy-acid oxidase [Bacillota bacterium]